ncbi:phosphotransferase family protein [Nocardia alba]|uniref:Phosphotransferase family enzyme n=1 Tax=Nocardia alba TaxID=225051 RepID=A0A4R1FV66_9NOCA|nr:phosphotransferase [Nocardia alba]TCJ97629.1 phosphotransferase family enzyme [Nocardia alba]
MRDRLLSVRAVGSAVGQALRVAMDRAVPGGAARVPLRVEDVTPAWLGEIFGVAPEDIHAIRVVESHSGTAARARIEVSADADIPEFLFLKLPPRNYLQHVLMNLFSLGSREVSAYRVLGDAPPIRVPRCYATRSDRVRGRDVLVLEDLSPTARFRTVVEPLGRDEAEAVVDAMADLHATFWRDPTGETDTSTGPRSDVETQLGLLIRRRLLGELTGPAADLVPATIREQIRIFYQRGREIDAFWARQPQTLIHGDPHLGNLFFEGARPGFLDWQISTTGCGIRDVAYFANASVEPELLREIERGLVERYAARLAAAGITADPERLWTLYQVGITELLLAIVCTAEAGERMQSSAVTRCGVARAVAGVEAHNSLALLAAFLDGSRV